MMHKAIQRNSKKRVNHEVARAAPRNGLRVILVVNEAALEQARTHPLLKQTWDHVAERQILGVREQVRGRPA